MQKASYFDGLHFECFGICPDTTAKMKRFPMYYGIQYVHSGSFYLARNKGQRFELKGPAAFLTSPENFIEYGSDTPRQHYHVCATGERIRSYIESGLFPVNIDGEPYVRILSPERFLADMLDLLLLLQNEKKHDFAVSKFEYMLLSIQDQKQENMSSCLHRTALEQLAQKIIVHPEETWNFACEAKKMNITLKHFMRLFQSIHGMPPVRFVLRQRLLKACTMLIQENAPIKSVASECGFQNEFYFSRAFKKYMKVSPGAYRHTV